MKKIIAWLLVLTLTAAVSIGATVAYLTDTDEDVNVMTLGKVKIDQLEFERIDDETENEAAKVQDFRDNKPLYPAVTEKGFDYTPGDSMVDWKQIGKDGHTSEIWDPSKINNEIDKMVFVKNKGDYDAFVRSVMAFEAAPGWSFADFKTKVHLNLNDTEWTWQWIETPVSIGEGTYFVAVATYNGVLKPGALTEISLSQIALDKTATNEDMKALGDTYNVLVKSQGIQADGFETAAVALDEGFGKITVANIPWESDSPFKGIDLYTALHYLNGDKTKQITASVANVYFDLDTTYPEIAETKGTLVDVEQDVPVYAHYVQNGSTYDVYFLAEDTIYLPRNSQELFLSMTKLKKVDTAQLDVSRVENMKRLFYKCSALSEVDTSRWNTANVTNLSTAFAACPALKTLNTANWDTSNVTDISYLFWKSSGLQSIDTTNWDVGNVQNMLAAFYNCTALETIGDTKNWDTSSVTNMEAMFNQCKKLQALDVSGWDVSGVTSLMQTFYNCQSLKALNVGKWDTGNVTQMGFTFSNCISLTELDLKNWNTGKVVNFESMFSSISSNSGNMKFTKLEVENWDTSSATDISYMFYGCGYITDLDLSKWDVSNVTTLVHTFADCFDMVNYNFTGWDTSSVTTMDGIFNSNRALQVIDLSAFDTQNIEDFDQTFDGCSELIQVIGMDRWDTSSLKYVQQFLTGTKVTVMDLSSFDMTNATHTWMMFSGNPELTTIYASENWNLNPAQLKNAGNMFGGCGKLTGANGTTTAGNPTDATYARIDLPAVKDADGNVITEAVPGYLTYKAAPVTP